jgi:hypothetical protein
MPRRALRGAPTYPKRGAPRSARAPDTGNAGLTRVAAAVLRCANKRRGGAQLRQGSKQEAWRSASSDREATKRRGGAQAPTGKQARGAWVAMTRSEMLPCHTLPSSPPGLTRGSIGRRPRTPVRAVRPHGLPDQYPDQVGAQGPAMTTEREAHRPTTVIPAPAGNPLRRRKEPSGCATTWSIIRPERSEDRDYAANTTDRASIRFNRS